MAAKAPTKGIGRAPNSSARSPSEVHARRVQYLVQLAQEYMRIPGRATSLAPSLAPDVASGTFYALHALALDPDSVPARRVLAQCYLFGGASLVFPFSPSSLGDEKACALGGAPSRASALATVHLLQRGPRATFEDFGCASVYSAACTALGRFREAQDALEWTHAHARPAQKRKAEEVLDGGRDLATAQLYTQLGRIAMKQARYTDATAYFTSARQADPLNWGAWAALCDMASAPRAAEAFADMQETESTPASGTLAQRTKSDEPLRMPSTASSKPVRRATPRSAAVRSGMHRAAPQRDDVPPVPPVPPVPLAQRQRADAPRPGTLATSRTNTNRAPMRPTTAPKLDAPRTARAVPQTLAARRQVAAAAEPLPRAASRSRAPKAVASRTDSGLRSRPPSAEDKRPASAENGTGKPGPDRDVREWTLALLRDIGEAYRLVRLYKAQEAVPLLQPDAPHRRTAAMHCLLGRALHDMTDYAEAEKQFVTAREMEPYLLMHMDIYSLVLFQLHREVALSALAQDLMEIDPRATQTHIAAGNTWSLQHQHDAAYQCFHQATLVSPECAYVYTLAGYEALELDQPSRAIRLFRSARRCDKRHWNALAGLGQVYLRQGNPGLASEAYAEAFLINSSNPVLLDLLGWALEQTGDLDGALAVYQRAIRMNPKAAMTRLKKAQLLLRTVHTSLRKRNQVFSEESDVPLLNAREAALRRAAAHTELLKVCALAPMEPQVHLLLARSYMRLGGGRFTAEDAYTDATPPTSPSESPRETRLPRQFLGEITHHLATAVDLDPRCIREVNAMGEGAKLALQGTHAGATIAEDEQDDFSHIPMSHAGNNAFLDEETPILSDGDSIDGDALLLHSGNAFMLQSTELGAYEPGTSMDMQGEDSLV
ncbi:anaphase-promoting complex subunit cdc27 [Malassezia vespertilionis]|uniref:Cdc27p n=1 Tax=Malassezia vespertilionis TaxID=2020962 RepID=A0A2N1J7U1_9BASI|nr:anaphase-promoting complex subunit cdc27 [Malassezia vespertilionis]PKI82609.1 Cdc27p [Malassezia vespertilionis]WFD08468.1 anaphase-promoting complex subunit cdc27 [Malassezia vespertilionis]